MNRGGEGEQNPYEVWVDFFDDAYRELYASLLHPVRTEFEVASVVKLLSLREGERILDLCCGDGRHSVPLQRRGMRVTGVDLALPMIQAARARGLRVIAEGDPQPEFVRADGGKLPLRAAFDAVLLLYNSISFGSRAMTEALLKSARTALGAGGRMLLECSHRDLESRAAMVTKEVESVGGKLGAVTIHRWFDPLLGEQHAQMRFNDAGGSPRQKHLRYLVYTPRELTEMLLGAGFAKVELFGGYDGRAFGIDTPAVLRATT